ncbi:MAG TPA: glutaredoxin domain-containing protein [Dehalococcoidia bacterium]|nr:glutaredoxin domain-containing protein [Dehalococcoidia bacterium]
MAPKVTVYSTPTCPWCHRAKKFLQENQVAYEEKDVASDHDARHEMIRISQQMGVPVIDIEGEVVIGFNEPVLRDRLLAQK